MSARIAAGALALLALAPGLRAQGNYKRTDSRRPYVHRIEILDARELPIDPSRPQAPPYSPTQTCKKCHDVESISRGLHFNAASASEMGRPGEPWILSDARTATQLPLSYRGWEGTWRPERAGLDPLRFTQTFGRHLPGGSQSYTGAAAAAGRWRLAGALEIDCMICHGAASSYSHELWAKQNAVLNFAWAPTAALGLGLVHGEVKGLDEELDPSTPEGREKLPRIQYDPRRFDADGKVFFEIVRRPSDAACYTCHSQLFVGDGISPRWNHDADVHLRAGLGCADCHRNGIEHHTVRGHAGERHPSGLDVSSLSCRGCHMDATDGRGEVLARGGRLGAPRALHLGLPPVHLERMSCTSCHSGPAPREGVRALQSAMAHGLGLTSQTRAATDLPVIAAPIQRKDPDGVVRPYRMMWPSFWGWRSDGEIEPMAPRAAYPMVRKAMRVRADLRAELGWEVEVLREKVAAALAAFAKKRTDAVPVFIAGGRAYRLAEGGPELETFESGAAEPYFWPLGHDVRPARQAAGAGGCTDCHAEGAPFLYNEVRPLGMSLELEPRATPMYVYLGQEGSLRSFWEMAFEGRSAFKWFGFAALGLLALVLLLYLLLGLGGLARLFARGGKESREDAV